MTAAQTALTGLVDSFAAELVDIDNEAARLAERKREIVAELTDMLEEVPDRGTRTLEGERLNVKITFRQNVSFTDKAKLHNLIKALGEKADSLFSVSIKEKTAAVENFIKSGKMPAKIREINEIRKVTTGAPTVKVEAV